MTEKEKNPWIYDLLLIVVLLVGTYFRTIGLNWDNSQHLHPDERFLTMVESAISPVAGCDIPDTPIYDCPNSEKQWLSIGEYFNTATSSLNPNNRGYTFYVYGDLPIFLVRYTAEWMTGISHWAQTQINAGQTEGIIGSALTELASTRNWAGYDEVALIGRQLSALADLSTLLLIYLIATRIYNRKVGLLAAAFSSLAVLQIQQSHFFTVDTFANFFMFLTTYFAVNIATSSRWKNEKVFTYPSSKHILLDPFFLNSIGFGIALGMSVASKLNAAPLAILLPGAFIVGMFRYRNPFKEGEPAETDRLLTFVAVFLVAGALASLISFRVFQPYAFSGPGFFNVTPDQHWVDTIREQRAQASGDIDVPFALQWARRSKLFSFENLTIWGLGLPLGILSWIGVLVMGWRILKGEWRQHSLLWGWTMLYFLWQSMQNNPTMRYQLPIYPLLAMIAAWVTFEGFKLKTAKKTFNLKPVTLILGGLVLILTFTWAFAFTRIYTRPHTRVSAARWIYQNVPGPVDLPIQTEDGPYTQPIAFSNYPIQGGIPASSAFSARASGTLSEISLYRIIDTVMSGTQKLTLSVLRNGELLAQGAVSADFGLYGGPYSLTLDQSVQIVAGEIYTLNFETSGGTLVLQGATVANESSWDDGLPLRMDGYDGFGGIYTGQNLELYWDDNPDKLQRFYDVLNASDYIFISSNRQWATTTRVPERYPLTTAYYRALIGCPPEQDVITCYNVARPGDYQGELGFEMVQVFESFPTLDIPGVIHWEANTQFAEEAFTVYDATKVLIFKKSADYSPTQVESMLSSVDLSKVVHLTPRRAADYKDLMLPDDTLVEQQAGGTWSKLFNTSRLINRNPILGLLYWYAFIFLLGLVTYPLVRMIFPGLKGRGYALSRAAGLVLLAYFSWLAGSLGLTYSRGIIGAVLAILTVAGLVSGWAQRKEILAEWKTNKRDFLLVEIIFLSFFIFDLLIRLGNPDLWHPAKGGERPMDFSYFNAVLKSTSFPPYDPWFAGGYINYYYYGFVLVGTPVKLLGIVPSIAYNFILPMLFAMVASGAFTIGYNLVDKAQNTDEIQPSGTRSWFSTPVIAGLAAAAAVVLLGNMGTIQMLYRALQRAGAPNGLIDYATIIERIGWAFKGLIHALGGGNLPIGRGDWYWNPSRVIPAIGEVEPITEFPFFTFLYSDLHAHMIVLPLTILAIAWAVSVIKAKAKWESKLAAGLAFVFAGIVVGAIKPTNTWDYYTYLPLTTLALGYAIWRGGEGRELFKRLLYVVGCMGLLVVLSKLFFQPFDSWFGQGYGQIAQWTGTHTPMGSYLIHWGLFLFVIIAWMSWETREWMANTPVSALQKLRPYQLLMEVSAGVLVVTLIALATLKVNIGWLALPLAVWALILILRPDQPDLKRLILFMIGTALLLTIVVEVIVLVGDISRMNTVFKLYLQAWTLLAISTAAAFGWLLPDLPRWSIRWRTFFEATGILLLTIAGLFTIFATADKIRDRMNTDAPHTLDSMDYMNYATYWDGIDMDLSQDYNAIRWMQENVQGSPVIVEGNTVEYRWGTRYTIYTGLPGVVGWNWHQRQQRGGVVPSTWVSDRVMEIERFYSTVDTLEAQAFLKMYNVRYIIVGQLEQNYYSLDGLAKFEQYDGLLWKRVFSDRNTVIYEVLP